jgi:hypothetical protein
MSTLNDKQHKALLKSKYSEKVVQTMLDKLWHSLEYDLRDSMLEHTEYTDQDKDFWFDQDRYSGIILNIMKSQCDEV